jgi:hypothetical protein
MAKKEKAMAGEFGVSKGYKAPDYDKTATKEARDPKLQAYINEEMSKVKEKVDPSPLPIPPTTPEPSIQYPDIARTPAYSMPDQTSEAMAQRLMETVGPKDKFGSSGFGIVEGLASGITPESTIAAGQTQEAQQEAAMNLAKLTGKTQKKQLNMPANKYDDIVTALSDQQTNRDATEAIRKWAMSPNRTQIAKKLGALQGLYTKAKDWIKGSTRTFDETEAARMRGYWNFVNSEIKRITGAQMSEPEARRLMRQMPDLHTKPKVFMKLWDDIMQERERQLFNRVEAFQRGGWNVGGIIPLYEQLKYNPYKRTPWPKEAEKELPSGKKKTEADPRKRLEELRRKAAQSRKNLTREQRRELRRKAKRRN